MSKLKNMLEGIEVVDAKRPITIEVLPRDIKGATKKKAGDCAVARACRRELDVKEVRVHLSRVYVLKGKYWTRYLAPSYMRNEIIVFDHGGTFAPSQFRLSVPTAATALNGRQGGPDRPSTGRKHKHQRVPPHRATDVRSMAILGGEE